MSKKKFTVSGQVINRQSRRGAVGLRIETWDKDLIFDDLVGSAVTDQQGVFLIEFTESYFQEFFLDRQPDLFFKVYRAEELIASTEDSVLWNQKTGEHPLLIEVDIEEPEDKSYEVNGTVKLADDSPLVGVSVVAYDKDIRREKSSHGEQVIGSSTTDENGSYTIGYSEEQFRLSKTGCQPLQKDNADLIIKVFQGDNTEPLILSTIIYNAGKEETVDLAVPMEKIRPLSPYKKLASKVSAFLGDRSIADLQENDEQEDITFVAKKIGIDKQTIHNLVKAEKLSTTTGIPTEFLFAFATNGMPVDDLRSLYSHRMPALRRTLKAAVDNNTLPQELESEIENRVNKIKSLAIKELLRPNPDAEELTIGTVLKSSRLSGTAQEHLVATALEVEGGGNEFWEQLAKVEGFTATDLNETRTTLQVAAFTGYHLPLFDRVLQKVRDNNDTLLPLNHLARLDEETWLEMVRESGVPEAVEGEDEETRLQTYTKALFRQVEKAFPTTAITARIKKSDWPLSEEISTFLSDYPEFDLLADSLDCATDIKLDEPVRKEVKLLQRLSRLTPHFKEITGLADAGIGSARQIAAMSPGAFEKKHGGAFEDKKFLKQTYQHAVQRTATTAHLRARYGREQDYGKFSVIPPSFDFEYIDPDAPELPEKPLDWEKLFGSQDMCHCEHCRSILGPASYLVDLLEFIRNETDGGLDVLFHENRRPDIAHINLNCHNTNTPLPYVDLVNEIFEQAVTSKHEEKNQTTWSQEELSANPEHIISTAYQVLSRKVYPWNLPFDLPAEESRIYLEHLGTSRYELMEVFHTADPLADLQVATEYLGLSERDKDILNGTGSIDEKTLWGLKDTEPLTSLNNPREVIKRSGLTLEELTNVLKLGFVNGWAKTPYLGISYGDNCKLETASVNLGIFSGASARLCRFVRLKRALGWETGELDAVLRAFRKDNSIGYIPLLTLSHLARLVEQLKLPLIELLTLFGELPTVPEITDRPSLYERVFLSKLGVHPDLDEEVEVRKVFAVKNLAASNKSKKIVDYLPHISASLGVSADTITDILDWLKEKAVLQGLDVATWNDDGTRITLASLSTLYRLVKLARTLRLNVPELLIQLDLMAIGPAALRVDDDNPPTVNDVLKPFETSEVLALVKTVEQVKNSGFRISELEYLLRHRFTLQSGAEKSLRERAKILDELRSGLLKIADEHSLPPALNLPVAISDLKGEMLREKLALVLPEDLVGIVLGWAKLENKPTEDQITQLIDATPVLTGEKRLFDFALTSSDAESIVIQFDFNNPKFKVEPDKSEKIQQNLDHVLRILIPWLRDTLSRSLIKQHLATALGLDAAITEKLLEIWVLADGLEPGDAAIQAFLAADFTNSEKPIAHETYFEQLTAATDDFPLQFRTLLRLQKVALVFAKLGITVAEATYLFAKDSTDWLDPRDLPLDDVISDPKNMNVEKQRFTGLLRLVDVCQLRDRIGGREPTLFDIFNLAEKAEDNAKLEGLHESIANRFGWNLDDLKELCKRFGLTSADAFKDERGFIRLEACFKLAKRIGVRITLPEENQSHAQPNILAWLADSGLDVVATSIKRAARSRYSSDETWAEVAHPLQNAIREKKRAALVGYLLNHFWMKIHRPMLNDGLVGEVIFDHPRDTNDLYSHFLIDPEMSACMLTSRIKQAISSVQLFIQRIFLQIESVQFEDIESAKTQWEWMKSYRVSEANKRVFITPENLIYPELRADKTPIFKEFESELQQNELTAEHIEKAYLNYIYKLEEVSNLDIRAQCYGGSKLHVFGRTKNTPYDYYYRFREDGIWSPWEKINIDIEGDHLLPVVWNNKLYLFWPILLKETDDADRFSDIEFVDFLESLENIFNSPGKTPSKTQSIPHWTIKIAWSRYNDSVWDSPKYIREIFVPTTKFYKYVVDVYGQHNSFDNEIDIRWPALEINELDNLFFRLGKTKNIALENIIPPYSNTASHISFELIDIDEKIKIGIYCPRINFTVDLSGVSDPYSSIEISQENLIGSEITLGKSLSVENYTVHTLEKMYWGPLHTPDYSYAMQANLISDFSTEVSYCDISTKNIPGIVRDRLWKYDEKVRWTFVPINSSGVTDTFLNLGLALFFSDGNRTFHIEWHNPTIFYHPFARDMMGAIYSKEVLQGIFPKCKDKNNEEGFYRQRKVRAFFDDKSPIKEPNEMLNIERKISYPGPSPEICKPREDFTFEDEEAYSCYNWELFFHIPLLIADKLSKNQQFEEALNWFHAIFDPLTPDATDRWDWQRPWKLGRFFDNGDATRSIEELMVILSKDNPSDTSDEALKQTSEAEIKQSLKNQITRWRHDPFNPHLLARMRITPYMKTVVMKYLDNLIAWADQLFRRDSIESINEATQLYILAAQILGDPPQKLPEREHQDRSYSQIKDKLDEFGNVLEEELPETIHLPVAHYVAHSASNSILKPNNAQATTTQLLLSDDRLTTENIAMFRDDFFPRNMEIIDWQKSFFDNLAVMPPAQPQPPSGLFFCIPQNEKLLEYWDTLADRLFKIRHCMNIEGKVRQLPLFEPPIDPGLLVKAAAAGIDFSTVLNDLNAPLPVYRFNVIVQKANEICQEVKSLGSALLSVLEKKDAEALGLLRSDQEVRLLESIRDVRKLQIKEAEETLSSLEDAKENAEMRRDSYSARIAEGKIEEEVDAINKRQEAKDKEAEAASSDEAARDWGWVPNFSIGTSVGVGFQGVSFSTTTGGMLGVHAHQSSAAAKRSEALGKSRESDISSINGQFGRSIQDWQLQSDIADGEVKQIEKQIAAAEIRVEIAQKELRTHEQQIENAKAVDKHLRTKFTNEELYDWMKGQIADVYFQTYQLAYDLAKRAERTYQFELGVNDSNIIKFGYWDNLKKGLLAGEKLSLDLKRLETSYLEKNRREYEITKNISLVLHDPLSLIQLKESGECEIILPEELFDADYPGHYFRRIKNVSLTIPCVVGPYASINCTLSLLSSRIRTKALALDTYRESPENADPRFRYDFASVQSIATSHGQNDNGMFELNFRDERYLPFEGTGALSRWRIELPKENNAFDFNTLSDVILRINYTAREGGQLLRQAAKGSLDSLRQQITNETGSGNDAQPGLKPALRRLFSVRHEFQQEWYAFMHTKTDVEAELKLEITQEHFPFLFRGKNIGIRCIDMFLKAKDGKSFDNDMPTFEDGNNIQLIPPGTEEGGEAEMVQGLKWIKSTWLKSSEKTTLLQSNPLEADETFGTGKWIIRQPVNANSLYKESVEDLLLVFTYTVGN